MRAPALVLVALLGLGGCAAPRPGPAPVPTGTPLPATPIGPPLEDARALALDPTGALAIADAGAATVLLLDTLGVPLAGFGGPGTGEYAFIEPSGVDPGNGLVLTIADTGNGRLQRFSRDGRLLHSIPVPTGRGRDAGEQGAGERGERGAGRPIAVAAAVTGELYAIEETAGVVLRWDARRLFDRVIGGREEGEGALRVPVDLALGADGRLVVADRGHGALVVYDVFGQYLRRIGDGQLQGVVAVTVVGERLVAVLPGEVRLYGLDGRLAAAFVPRTGAPLVDAAGDGRRLFTLTRTRLFVSDWPTNDGEGASPR